MLGEAGGRAAGEASAGREEEEGDGGESNRDALLSRRIVTREWTGIDQKWREIKSRGKGEE